MSILLSLLIIISAARIFGEVAKRFGQPAVVGEIVAGLVLGPTIFGVIQPTPTLETLAELGIFFLMFVAGMEISTKKMARVGIPAFLASVFGMIIPFVLGYYISDWIGFSPLESAIIGISLSITAVAVSIDTLMDIRKFETKMGSTIVEAGIIDDIFGLLLLSGVIAIASGHFIEEEIFPIFIKISSFFIVAVVVGYYMVPKILEASQKVRIKEGPFSVTVILILLYGLGADAIGLSGIVGAFFAGLFVRHSAERGIIGGRDLLEQFSALALGLLTPIFFVWLGLLFSFEAFISYFGLVLLLIMAAIVSKVIGGSIGSRIGGFNWNESLVVGVGMNSRGAITLVVAEIARKAGIISTGLFSVIVVIALITTLLTPPLLKKVIKLAERKPWSRS